MSTSIRPPSPTGPSSASVTTTTASTSAPRSTSGAGLTSSSSVSSPAPMVPPPLHPSSSSSPLLHRRRPSLPLPSPTNPTTLPTPSQTAQIVQARDALVASLGNVLDTELQSRAGLLHGNQRAIEKQEREVGLALEELRREDERLMKVLNEGSRKVKELGDVQNWAERLERDFLVVEETMRLVNEGDGSSGSWSGSGSESGSWSGSESGSEAGDDAGDVRMSDGDGAGAGDDKGQGRDGATMCVSLNQGKQVAIPSLDAMDVDQAPSPAMHDTALDSGSSSIVTAIKAPERDATASPLSSPGPSSWLKRFIWRS